MGRKAALLGWADAGGMATPGGFVVPAEGFWEAVESCGALGQARYLEQAALRLDPVHAVTIAASIVEALQAPAVDELAVIAAETAFRRLAAPLVVCRSSAAMEDGRAAAFPGVFASVLGLHSPAALATAVAGCWRSALSADAIRYLLRVRAEPVDFSLALLLQRQVEAQWYGVYVSADPVTGAAEPVAELSDQGPEALVGGAEPAVQARRRKGRWTGAPELAASLEAVRNAAARLSERLASDVEVEFALPGNGAAPVILQCRPLTVRAPAAGASRNAAGVHLHGRPCAAGKVTGMAGDTIVVVDRLTTADYGIVLGSAGVVAEHDASPLSHVAVLCRELGVPFVCGVAGAIERLTGRWVTVDGGAGEVEILAEAPATVSLNGARPAAAGATLTAVELLLRVLTEGRPGHDPAAEAERLGRRYARDLGAESVSVVGHPVDPDELDRLERLAAELFGPGFSAAAFLAGAAAPYRRRHVPEHHTPPRPRAAGDG